MSTPDVTAPAASRKSLSTQRPIVEEIVRFAVEEPDQFQLITEIVAQKASERKSARSTHEYADGLMARYDELMQPHVFESGQLVMWKEGLKNRRRPDYGEPAVIVEVLSEPVLSGKDESSSTYFREPLDLILGVMDEGEMIVYHFDSRRFRPYDGPATSTQ